MKYLSDYTNQKQTELFNRTGTFFAFSKQQYEEEAVDGVKYASLDGGFIVPKDNIDELLTGLESIHTDGISQDIAENGIKGIIWRELANHEAQITCDITETVESLEGYPITRKDVQAQWAGYWNNCVENNYF
jgi:hypothetical protein